MADNLERRDGGSGWIWLLLALVVLALVFWWAVPPAEQEAALDEVPAIEEVEPMEPVAEPSDLIVASIVADPEVWTGRTVDGEAEVAEVATDRGFWITDREERLFVVIDPVGGDAEPDVNPETTVLLEAAVVRDPSFVSEMTGLDPDTRRILEGVTAFLVVEGDDVRVLEPGPA